MITKNADGRRIMEAEVKLSKQFVNSIWELSGIAIKCYIILVGLEELSKPEDGWVEISYETFLGQSGIKSTKTIREGLIELARLGWIKDYQRGGYRATENHRVNFPNKYKVSSEKVTKKVSEKVLGKMKGIKNENIQNENSDK